MINNSGQIVGTSYVAGNPHYDAFLYSNGTLTDLGTFGGGYSSAAGINDSGQIIVLSQPASTNGATAFLYSNGHTTELWQGAPTGINNSGEVVGRSYTGAVNYHTLVYSNGQVTDLGTFGGLASGATAVNDSGQIVGQIILPGTNNQEQYLYSNGQITNLGSLGGSGGFPAAINKSGQIVGWAYLAGDAVTHGYLYKNGEMKDLNNLIPSGSGFTITSGNGINASGQITASGVYNGQRVALLLTPVQSVPAMPKWGSVMLPILILVLIAYRLPRRQGYK